MAHTDAARGLRWVGSLDGGKSGPKMIDVVIPASTTLYTGCMVTCTTAGVIALAGATAFGATTTKLLGVSPGYLPSQSAATNFQLISPWDAIFEIQLGNSATAIDTLAELNAAITNGTVYGYLAGASAISGLNISAMELDLGVSAAISGPPTLGTHIFQIVGYSNRPGNAIEATTGDLKGHVRVYKDNIALGFGATAKS